MNLIARGDTKTGELFQEIVQAPNHVFDNVSWSTPSPDLPITKRHPFLCCKGLGEKVEEVQRLTPGRCLVFLLCYKPCVGDVQTPSLPANIYMDF